MLLSCCFCILEQSEGGQHGFKVFKTGVIHPSKIDNKVMKGVFLADIPPPPIVHDSVFSTFPFRSI